MKKFIIITMLLARFFTCGVMAQSPASNSLAERPPLGWNSYDCYGTSIVESQFKACADVLAGKLLPYGYHYAVLDAAWYNKAHRPGEEVEIANNKEVFQIEMDEYSRQWRALERYPSAANGKGFKPLADYVHSKGMKFGIHIMRGIARQAVKENTGMMNLWCILRSPLMWGGDPVTTPEKYWQYLTNRELLEVNQNSHNNRQIYNKDDKVIWVADIPGSSSKYLALFNMAENKQSVNFEFYWEALQGSYVFRDLWKHAVVGEYAQEFEMELPAHGSVIYKVTPAK